MPLTQYQPYGLPGQIRTFSAKAASLASINIIAASVPTLNHVTDSRINLVVAGDIEVQGDGWFDGEVTFTQVATGVFPTTGDHLATKEYIDLAIGMSFDLFLSDTDDGVVADTHVMYAEETDEAETTEDSPSLSDGDNQLALSWLSEAGVPGTATIREGVYDCHIHLNKNSGGATTTVYWKLSYVDSNGTSGKILICTSETSDVITTSEVGYDIHAVVTAEVPLGATKRLLFEVYVNISVGQDVTLTATLEGVVNSHISFQLPSSIWQHHGDVLNDLNTLGQVGADSEFLVGTGAGALAWESGATARTSIGLGTANTVTFNDIITKSPWIDIRAYGAVADGESDITVAPSGTDNTTAIQAALDAANAAGGGNILVPPGTFEHSGILNIYSKTRLYGENYGASALRFTNDVGVGITTSTAESFITLEQLKIFTSDKDNGDSSQGAVGFRIRGTSSEIKVLNCNIHGYSTAGIMFADAMNNVVIDGGYISNCGDNSGAGILSPSGITSANAIRIVNITLGSNNGWGIRHTDEGKGWYIAGCLIEGNVDGGITLARLNGCEIIGNYFENTAAGTVQINLQDLATAYNTAIDIRGNWFSGHADATRISLDYVDTLSIENNHFQSTSVYQITAVSAARIINSNKPFTRNYDAGSAGMYDE